MALRSLLPFQTRFVGPGGTMGDPFLALHRELNRAFDEAFRASGAPGGLGATLLAVHIDVAETDKEIRISAELPGVSEDDIQVELTDDILTIRGEKQMQETDAQHHVRERSFGAFSRSIQLPFVADPNHLEASFANGVLTVTVPKAAAQQQSHRIQIKSGASGQAGSVQPRSMPNAAGKATDLPPGQGPSGV